MKKLFLIALSILFISMPSALTQNRQHGRRPPVNTEHVRKVPLKSISLKLTGKNAIQGNSTSWGVEFEEEYTLEVIPNPANATDFTCTFDNVSPENFKYISSTKDSYKFKALSGAGWVTTTINVQAGDCKAKIDIRALSSPEKTISLITCKKLTDLKEGLVFSENGKAKFTARKRTENCDKDGNCTGKGKYYRYDLYFTDVVDVIPAGAFMGRTSIVTVILPPSVKTIERLAFQGCPKLWKVVFPEGLEYIGDMAFMADLSSDQGLTEFTLPKTLKYIGEEAFRDVRCKKITIPAGVKLGYKAFWDTGALKEVYLYDTTPDNHDKIFCGQVVHVPKSAYDAYKAIPAYNNKKLVTKLIGDL